ncbi:hypothetical protein [Paracoccus seriniphilus]|uniref:Uncharacterized protein n=1 Tax=Paracoccus seriniphilus TaxID=184748 RepID=A0A239Q3B9_9RHOB|nr:hypothetical protein [Paracoccus seriniphilus]WCR16277.1 hypothetical protein JHW44_19625 [Paracoccus seriniphilus]SNT76808.1 hypothetical protein SAMN05444959_1297 [Paracoccus seriniphilus]
MRDLPTPEQILEELADKTAAHMDRKAVVAFDGALAEMTRYHRFLLALNASQARDGTVFSFAEVAGGSWNKPHQDWTGQYRRLFERAADQIPNETHYIRSLAHIPSRLLPGSNDPSLTTDVTNGILDLGPMMMHRLEAWVTKRTVLDTPEGQSAKPRLSLAGSDARAFESILPGLVGAWESILERAPRLYNWGERGETDEAKRWEAFRRSWPFLWQHLTNTAYCLAITVWNEDEIAASLFREALVRWPETFQYVLDRDADLPSRRYLFPDVMQMDWPAASGHAASFAHENMQPLTTDQVFSNMIRGAHDDVILLTAGLLLFWTMNEKQTSNIGGQTAWALLKRESGCEHRNQSVGDSVRLQSLFLDFLRIEMSGDKNTDESYAVDLDKLVESLDRMTERRVVPGRIYTPSTLHGRDGILMPLAAVLAAVTPENGDDSVSRHITEIAEKDEVLPGRDRSLRRIIRALKSVQSILEEPSPDLEGGVSVLKPELATRKAIDRLRTIVEDAIISIETKRRERLQERPVDPAKLERIRSAVEAALLNEAAEVPFFRDVRIEQAPHNADADPSEITFLKIDKAQMVDPIMESSISNFDDWFIRETQQKAGRDAWDAFKRRPRMQTVVSASVEEDAFWKQIAGHIEQVGPDPILVISQSAEGHALRSQLDQGADNFPDLRIERRPRDDAGGSYIVTVEGVDVFGADFPAGVGWLFSGQMLQQIRYAELGTSGRYVDIAFELKDEEKVDLRFGFRHQFVWNDRPIFEIKGQDA